MCGCCQFRLGAASEIVSLGEKRRAHDEWDFSWPPQATIIRRQKPPAHKNPVNGI